MANRLVLTLQRLYTFTTIRVKVPKNFEPNHAYVLIRHNTTLPRCDCIGTLRGLYKESLYVCVGPCRAVPQKTQLPSPAPQHKLITTKRNNPNTTYSSSNYLAKTRAIWYCGCTVFLGCSPCSN